MLYSLCQGVFLLPTPFSARKLSCKVLVTPYQNWSQGDYVAVIKYFQLLVPAWVLWDKCSFSWDVRLSCFSQPVMIMSKVLVISVFWGSVLFVIETEILLFYHVATGLLLLKVIYEGIFLFQIFSLISPILSDIMPSLFASIFPPI